MNKIENLKSTSRLICKTGVVFQIVSAIFTGFFLLAIIPVSILRTTINGMSQPFTDFDHMGLVAEKLAREGKIAEAAIVFLLSAALLTLIITILMHFIVRIFQRICDDYSPFLPKNIKDLKAVSLLATLLILQSSIGLGVIAAFIFWGITQLYEYGCELQNQADETL